MPQIERQHHLTRDHDDCQTPGNGQSHFQRGVTKFQQSDHRPTRRNDPQEKAEYEARGTVNVPHRHGECH